MPWRQSWLKQEHAQAVWLNSGVFMAHQLCERPYSADSGNSLSCWQLDKTQAYRAVQPVDPQSLRCPQSSPL